MFVNQIRCALARATAPVVRLSMSSRGSTVPLSVRIGRAMVAAAVFAAPVMMSLSIGRW